MIIYLSNRRMARSSLACRKRGFLLLSPRMQRQWFDLAFCAHAHASVDIYIQASNHKSWGPVNARTEDGCREARNNMCLRRTKWSYAQQKKHAWQPTSRRTSKEERFGNTDALVNDASRNKNVERNTTRSIGEPRFYFPIDPRHCVKSFYHASDNWHIYGQKHVCDKTAHLRLPV